MSKINIMVVEDESIVAKDIQQSLKKLGYNVADVCNTGEAAVVSATEKRPDLILMDIMLKGEMSGIDAAEKIRDNLNIPVVFLTAYADESTLNKAKITEPYGYIIKPFKEVDLHTTIEMAIYKHDKVTEVKKERDLLYSIVESKENKGFIFIKSNSRFIRLKTEDIMFVEALKDYVTVNTVNQKFTIHTTMKEIESKLPVGDFIRVHRSFIVRIDKIFAIDSPNIILEDEKKVIPIGGSYRDELLTRLNMI
jgi:DNA-binding LytR/AlgR family response regulator